MTCFMTASSRYSDAAGLDRATGVDRPHLEMLRRQRKSLLFDCISLALRSFRSAPAGIALPTRNFDGCSVLVSRTKIA
jgi:hypothetical protein